MNRFKRGSQTEYRAAIIEYGKYFQDVAKSLGVLYLHPFDLAQFFVKMENIFKGMEDLQKLRGTLSVREDLIRCAANEIFLYDTWDGNKHMQVACAVHLLHEGQNSEEFLEIFPMTRNTKLRSPELVQTMNLSKVVSSLLRLILQAQSISYSRAFLDRFMQWTTWGCVLNLHPPSRMLIIRSHHLMLF